jgi:ABC-type dipeptide/oligopeptide/nickel transport system permease component
MDQGIDIRVERQGSRQVQEAARMTLGLALIAAVIGFVLGIYVGFGAQAIQGAAHCW